jgi:DNA polymerase III alpha subunit (gram-positive type)
LNFLAIDTETGGLDERYHALLSSAFILFDSEFKIIDKVHFKIQPHPDKFITSKAAQINGYHPDKWKNAISLDPFMKTLYDWTKSLPDVKVLAHNAKFDQRFLWQAERETNTQLFLPNSWTCTLQEFKRWRFLVNEPGSCKLDELCYLINYRRSKYHSAEEDAIICGLGYHWLNQNGLTL